MSVQMSVKVEGFEDLFKQMDALAEEIGKGKTERIWRNALKFAMEPVLDRAKSLAPRDTGQLADHLYIKVHKPQSRDKSSKYFDGEMYMARVTLNPDRQDSVQNTVLNKRGKFQTYSVNRPVGLAQEFGTSRMKEHKPFLRPALESSAQDVIDRLGKSVWYELTWGKYAQKD